MAYTAVKLADVQKAIAAVTAANKKYTDAQASTKTSQTAVSNAQKALDTARAKLETLQSAFDDQSYLPKNPTYQKAQSALVTAEKNRDTAQTKLDAATDKNRAALEKAFNTANKAVDTANAGLEKARAAAEKAYQDGTIKPARVAYEKANTVFETAQNKHQSVLDSIQPLIDSRNEAIDGVKNYVNDIRNSLGDVNKLLDANEVKKLLGQIESGIKATKLDELIKPVSSLISEIDPIKMANIPKVNIDKANPDYFPNIDSNTGLPVLDQGALDKILDKYGSNSLNKDQYRDNYNKFGWNVKSDGSSVARGAAIFGLQKQQSFGGVGSPAGVSYSGDFNKAAQQLGLDISGLKTNEEKYNAINEASKDYYVVANALDRTGVSANRKAPHAAIMFKADGSGNLVPVMKSDGQVAATYYDAVGVSHAGWRGQLAELAPVISIASMAFLPGLGQALGQSIAGTTAGAALGAAGSQAVANAAIGAGMAALTGGDPLKAAVMAGAGTAIASNADKIAQSVGISGDAIKNIATAANITEDQAKNIIANGVSTALASGITGSEDILKDVISNVAGNFADAKAVNAVVDNLGRTLDAEALSAAANVAGNVANIAGNMAISGGDLSAALNAAAPGILSSAATAARNVTSTTTGAAGFPLQTADQDQYRDQLIAAGFNPAEAEDYAATLFKSRTSPLQIGPMLASTEPSKVSVEGLPLLEGDENRLKTDLPTGYRLASYDEAIAKDLTATELSNGQYAYLAAVDPSTTPDYSTITGQAGAGAGASFGVGTPAGGTATASGLPTGVPSGVPSGAYLPYFITKSGQPVTPPTTPTDVEKMLPPVEVVGEAEEEIIDDTTKASQEFPLTPEEETKEATLPSGTSPRQQILDLYATLTSQPQTQKPTTKWFDRFLGTTMPTPGYKSIFDPTEYELFDSEVPEQVEFQEPVVQPPTTTDQTTTSPLTQATTLSSNPQAYTMQGAATMPSNYYQYGDLNPLNIGSSLITPQTGTPYRQGGLASMRPTAALFSAHGGQVPHKGSHYVQGEGGGQDDLIDARLADGEYVFDADIVAALGDGSNAEGARRLDKMREAIRKHKRSAPNDKIPPKAKSPLAYFKGAK